MKARLISAAIAISALTSNTASCASAATTLKAYEASDDAIVKPYEGSIQLADGAAKSGKQRAVDYRISLKGPKCHTTLEGRAVFFADKDEMGDDSSFLRNGEVVKTRIFKGSGTGGDVMLIMDVESKNPRYANVMVSNASVADGGCVKAKAFGVDFY
jgi:hypothetical protein